MPGVTNDKLLGVLKTTLANLPMGEFETTFKYQHYEAVSRWFQKDRRVEDGGTSFKRHIQLDANGNAAFVLPYEQRPINVADSLFEIDVPWVQVNNYWVTNRDEMLRNRGRAKFIDLIETRRLTAYKHLANVIEERAIQAPMSETDKRFPRGLPYWISMRPSGSSGAGFDGYTVRFGDGTTSVTKGGINGQTNELWRNYAATYTGVNDDLFSSMRRGRTLMGFRPPPMPATGSREQIALTPSNFSIYMGIDEFTEYEDKATKQNDNFGPDVAVYNGVVFFSRIPVVHMPTLDSAAYDPIYFVNHNHFYPVILGGEWLLEHEPMSAGVNQHRTFVTHVDSSFNIVCDNVRHGGGVFHKVI